MNIRTKLTSYFALIAIISVSITALLTFQKAQDTIKQKTFDHLTTAVILKEGEINIWMQENISSLRVLQEITQKELDKIDATGHNEHTHEIVEKKLNDYLTERKGKHLEFQEIFVLDTEKGAVHISTDKTQLSKIKLTSPYYIEGKKDLFIQNFYYSPSLGETTTTISAPLKDQTGKTEFVIAARLNISQLNAIMVESGGLDPSSETYLVNRYNQPITPLKHSSASSSLGIYSQSIKDCLSGRNGTALYQDYTETPVIGAYQWLPSYGICAIAQTNQAEAFHDIKVLQKVVFATSLLILVAAILSGVLASLSISRPIKRLTEVAKSFSEGQFHKKVDKEIMQEKNEIGILARTIDEMQQELKRTLSETQTIIESMPSALFVLRNDGSIELANKAGKELFGLSHDELINTPLANYFEDKNLLKKLIKNKKEKSSNYNTKVISKSGEKTNAYISIARLKAKKHFSGGLIVVIKDISELKRYAKNRIDELTPILNQISLGDFEASVTLPNNDDEFTNLVVALNLMTDNLKELITENQKKTKEVEESNEKLATSHRTLVIAKEGIEKEKAKAEALLGSIGEGIMATNEKGKIIMMNNAAEELFGLETKDMLGETFMKCCKFQDEKGKILSYKKAPIANATKSMKPVFLTTYYKKITGKNSALATTISPIVHAGKSNGIIATFHDISKEKEIDLAKTEFVSLASHQLRTPLTAIKWIIEELLHNKKLTKKQNEYLHDALKSNKRMIGLVNDLLNVSRLETGNISVTSVKTDVTELINQVLLEAKALCIKKKQKIAFKKPAKPVNIEVDPQLLRQIVGNLVSNSIKYSDSKTTINIELQKKKTRAVIKVSDQGIGIPKGQQSRIFEKFFRTGEAVKRSTSGSGLGLYIIKKVIDAMRGDITFKSIEGKGSTFSISLPPKGPTKSGDVKKLIEHRVS